jgi:MFS family permease
VLEQSNANSEIGNFRGTPSNISMTPLQWTICAVAALGFAFDLYETLMLPLIVRPALTSLGHLKPGTPQFNHWVGVMFFVPNVVGGIFGLIGGYLTDLFGRRRVLLWSILLYSVSACAAAYSTSLGQLLFFRATTLIGVSVEFVAAITWLAEIFPSPKRRELVLGYTQAFHTAGGLLVASAYYVAVTYAERFPLIRGGHQAWRYTLLSGLAPALPLLLVRPFLPESPLWLVARREGTLKRPSLVQLFQPRLRKTTVVATLAFAFIYALTFGAIQQTVRMVPGLVDVQRLGLRQVEQAASKVQIFQELGGMTGRILFAVVLIRIVSQRRRLRVFLVPALFVFAWLYFYAATCNLLAMEIGLFLATMLFNGMCSFWGNYLPRMYPTHLRATGESFAVNIGGRMIGVCAALATTTLSSVIPGRDPSASLAYSAGTVSVVALIAALLAASWLPEPTAEQLPL